jgi:hypothetical protein
MWHLEVLCVPKEVPVGEGGNDGFQIGLPVVLGLREYADGKKLRGCPFVS